MNVISGGLKNSTNKQMEFLLAIIPNTVQDIKKEIELIRGMVDWVQVDVMDGMFVPPITWPYANGNASELREIAAGGPKIELHLMIQEPNASLEKWIGSGASRILTHIESTVEMRSIIDRLKSAGIEAGIALDLETSIDAIHPYAQDVGVVQLMSIERLGYHGQLFSNKVLDKIRSLRKQYPDLPIQVDGGINLETGKLAAEAGATSLVVGSAILNSKNLEETIYGFKLLGGKGE
jgi:ribulose-phosphate 3-epimerase